MDISGMFAVLAVLALLGILLYALVRFLHTRIVFWAKPDRLRSENN
jgi:NitT/TauT family transport system permease protein